MFSYKCNVKNCPPCSVLTFVVHVGFILLFFFAGFCVAVIAPRIKWKKWRRVIMIFQRLQWLVILSYSKGESMRFVWLVLLNSRYFFSFIIIISGLFILIFEFNKEPFFSSSWFCLLESIDFFLLSDIMIIYVRLLMDDKDKVF